MTLGLSGFHLHGSGSRSLALLKREHIKVAMLVAQIWVDTYMSQGTEVTSTRHSYSSTLR